MRAVQRRWNTVWNMANWHWNDHHHVVDEDVDHPFSLNRRGEYHISAEDPRQSPTHRTWGRAWSTWECTVENQNEAHLQEQLHKVDNSYNHVQLLDVAKPGGVKGLWLYPFFVDHAEQQRLAREMAPVFRNPKHSKRVKNTATIMRNAYQAGPSMAEVSVYGNVLRHAWQERNHPSIEAVGRRNVVHMVDDQCTLRK
eukprot:Sspe_Gene.33253::Locus_16246_Transcript_1_1_Confidence_1.000_Length_2973::g.33253::m.33253